MSGKVALFVSACAMLSAAALAQTAPDDREPAANLASDARDQRQMRATPGRSPIMSEFEAQYRTPALRQVRIEQRVIVRIAPQSRVPRQSLMAELPQQAAPPRLVERKMDDCVRLADIAGVQTSGANKLVLFLRDRRMVSATLEHKCLARDFYSGFYVEENDDGRLCINRDKLQSRAGAKCDVERMRQLVPE